MTGTLRSARRLAIPRREKGFGIARTIARAARRLWPRKTAAELAWRAKCSQRACEFWLSAKHDISGEALAALLRSDDGITFLDELMGAKPPAWWLDVKRQYDLAQLRRAQEAHRALLDRLEQGAGE
jgi:hypothetical protein